jgi:mannose-1-phosphate guanylyltransferase
VERSVVLDGAHIGARTRVTDAIVAPGAQLAQDVVVENGAMVGDEAVVGRDNLLSNGIKVFPGAVLADGTVRF